ncbi:MAG: hypothetical protein MJ169_03790 [Treponema sp.]|nr:hypothetical protein [Treponema sp.]
MKRIILFSFILLSAVSAAFSKEIYIETSVFKEIESYEAKLKEIEEIKAYNNDPLTKKQKKLPVITSQEEDKYKANLHNKTFFITLQDKAKEKGFEFIYVSKPDKFPCYSISNYSITCKPAADRQHSYLIGIASLTDSTFDLYCESFFATVNYFENVWNESKTKLPPPPQIIDYIEPASGRIWDAAVKNDGSMFLSLYHGDRSTVTIYDKNGIRIKDIFNEPFPKGTLAGYHDIFCPQGNKLLIHSTISKKFYSYSDDDFIKSENFFFEPATEGDLSVDDEEIVYKRPTSRKPVYSIAGTNLQPPKYLNFSEFEKRPELLITKRTIYRVRKNFLDILDTDNKVTNVIFLPYQPSNLNWEQIIPLEFTDDSKLICRLKNDFYCFKIDQDKNLSDLNWVMNCSDPLFDKPKTDFVNYRNGIYYFKTGGVSRATTGKIIRCSDTPVILSDHLSQITNLTKSLSSNKYENSDAYHKIADLYYNAGNIELALQFYNKYLEVSPADSKIKDKVLREEFNARKKEITAKYNDILSVKEETGYYTAKNLFNQNIESLERLIKQNPSDIELQNQYNTLISTFDPANKQTASIPAISIEETALSVLFPALQNVYGSKPCGTITLKNTSKEKIKNVRVQCFAKKIMDFPSDSKSIAVLKPQESCTINLNVYLNDSVFNQNEDTIIQMQYTILWEQNNTPQSISFARPVTLYKKSTISWNDTAMLSCFIMPNDPTVSKFVYDTIQKSPDKKFLSRNIYHAMELTDSLGTLPLNYVSDPQVPFSSIIENKYAVDTVKFPAETLIFKGGDCDDMTTLFCSVCEASGIPTALITVPGHIFAAFNTGLKNNKFWQELSATYKTIEYNGELWIPIETTAMTKGFEHAWLRASQELKDTEPEEFIVLSQVRNSYPPMAADIKQTEIAISDKLVTQLSIDSSNIQAAFFAVLASSEETKSAATLNIAAKMYYLLGDRDKSIQLLKKAVSLDPNFKPAKQNLTQLTKNSKTDSVIVKSDDKTTVTRAADKEELLWIE